jgi:glutamine synthetase adenylyltransferase
MTEIVGWIDLQPIFVSNTYDLEEREERRQALADQMGLGDEDTDEEDMEEALVTRWKNAMTVIRQLIEQTPEGEPLPDWKGDVDITDDDVERAKAEKILEQAERADRDEALWDDVVRALSDLYTAYYARDCDAEDELHALMKAYNTWLG